MSAEIVAVLVVPSDGDPGGLLWETALGAFPPYALKPCWPDGEWLAGTRARHRDGKFVPTRDDSALPLWWDGALVAEGWYRAAEVGGFGYNDGGDEVVPTYPPLDEVLRLGRMLIQRAMASRVVTLKREAGVLVEVP